VAAARLIGPSWSIPISVRITAHQVARHSRRAGHSLPARVGIWDCLAVQEDGQRAREGNVPVLVGHLDAAGRNQAMSVIAAPRTGLRWKKWRRWKIG
jgi:hypothetical protein